MSFFVTRYQPCNLDQNNRLFPSRLLIHPTPLHQPTYHSLASCLYARRMSCRVACFVTPRILYGSVPAAASDGCIPTANNTTTPQNTSINISAVDRRPFHCGQKIFIFARTPPQGTGSHEIQHSAVSYT